MITLERVKNIIKAKEENKWRVCKMCEKMYGTNDSRYRMEFQEWSTLFTVLRLMEDEKFLKDVEGIYYDK